MTRWLAVAAIAVAPLAVLAESVQIPGPSGPLEGEAINVPDAAHAVVIIPGSGPTDRDGNTPQFDMMPQTYKLLAEDLARAGISSLRIDKRGFFGSEAAIADPNDVTIAAYADDVQQWTQRASAMAECVWLAGHSEGGLVALVAAQEPPEPLCGLILLSTPGRPVGDLMLEQFAANPANGSLMPELESLIGDLVLGQTRSPDTISAPLRPLFSAGLQRYMTDLFSYDPGAVAAQWSGPVLIVQGDADLQVKPQDADLLAQSMGQAARLSLPGGTHMLKMDTPDDVIRTYRDPDLPLHPDLVPGIRAFLQ